MNNKTLCPKYPNVIVKLLGANGNAFYIIGTVTRSLRKNNVSSKEIQEYCREAMSGNYDHLLRTTMQWVTVK